MQDARQGWRDGDGGEAGGLIWRTLRNLVVLATACGIAAWLVMQRDEAGAIVRQPAKLTQSAVAERPPPQVSRDLIVRKDASGHFLVDASVNGAPVTFLVDTGATTVVLTPDDARRVGLNLRRLTYDQRFEAASGAVRGAPVNLRAVSIGQLTLRNVAGTVLEMPGSISLLGMTFLGRLDGYEVRADRMILHW